MEISSMRKEILDMASTINTHEYKIENFDRCWKIYDEYEKILEENNMENGQVEASMQIIQEAYKKKIANGEL